MWTMTRWNDVKLKEIEIKKIQVSFYKLAKIKKNANTTYTISSDIKCRHVRLVQYSISGGQFDMYVKGFKNVITLQPP